MKRAVVAGCGSYLPSRIVTNFDLEASLDTSDSWIRERTGIAQRHIAAADERTSDLAIAAGRAALADARIAAEAIDLILLATATPDFTFPATAPLVQAALGCGKAAAMDINGACSGFVYAMQLADAMIRSGSARHVLVIGAETMSRVVDWGDRGTCILFGDGAGALVLRASDDAERGVIACRTSADGGFATILKTDGGVSSDQRSGVMTMQGKEVFRHAVSKMCESSNDVLAAAGIDVSAIDWVVPHQANARILTACADRLGIDRAKLVMSVERHANTSSASIPLALAEAAADGRLKEGNLVLLTALGAGLTWGSCIIRW